jgi:hypothetical protein
MKFLLLKFARKHKIVGFIDSTHAVEFDTFFVLPCIGTKSRRDRHGNRTQRDGMGTLEY